MINLSMMAVMEVAMVVMVAKTMTKMMICK